MRRSEGAARRTGAEAPRGRTPEAGHQAGHGSPATGTGARPGASRRRRRAASPDSSAAVEKVLSGTLTAPMRAAASQATTNSGPFGYSEADPGAEARPGGQQGPGQLGRPRPCLGVGERLVVHGEQHVFRPLGRTRSRAARRRSAAGRRRPRSRPRSRRGSVAARRRGAPSGRPRPRRPRPRTARVVVASAARPRT